MYHQSASRHPADAGTAPIKYVSNYKARTLLNGCVMASHDTLN